MGRWRLAWRIKVMQMMFCLGIHHCFPQAPIYKGWYCNCKKGNDCWLTLVGHVSPNWYRARLPDRCNFANPHLLESTCMKLSFFVVFRTIIPVIWAPIRLVCRTAYIDSYQKPSGYSSENHYLICSSFNFYHMLLTASSWIKSNLFFCSPEL